MNQWSETIHIWTIVTSLVIVFSVHFFNIMLRNHSFLPHRYSIRFALLLVTLD